MHKRLADGVILDTRSEKLITQNCKINPINLN